MSNNGEGQRVATGSENPLSDGTDPFSRDHRILVQRAAVGVLKAPAPHLRHSLPTSGIAGPSSSAGRMESMDPSPDVNSGRPLHAIGWVHHSDDTGTARDSAMEQAFAAPRPQRIALNALHQVRHHRNAATSSSSGANGVPEWAEPLQHIKRIQTRFGGRIRDVIIEGIARSPPAQAREKLRYSLTKEVFKSNNAGRTKKLALEVLRDAQSGVFGN